MSEENNETKATEQQGDKKFDFNQMLQDLWNGKLPLFKVFWLYYFATVVVLGFLASMLAPLAKVFSLLSLVWAGFMVKPIWVAAEAYKGEKLYAMLAKGAAVLIAIATFFRFIGF